MIRFAVVLLLTGCIQRDFQYLGRAPNGAPEFQRQAAWAREWNWAPQTRAYGESLYSVTITREKMLELTGGINAYGLSRFQEPFVFFVREDVLMDPVLMCKVTLHEMTHLMSYYEKNTMDAGHCSQKFEELKLIQKRICGEAEFEVNQPRGDCG